ncbi:CBS domain-containing protein [Actinomadura gamaensis]|uniref:CBS domain-containing protein n=1 Tax=Actinomadura gamaensis TaxID=1763541 RepID=A0ABV9TU05_9ACTN
MGHPAKTLVEDVMTRRVVAVALDTPYKTVLLAMRMNRVNAMPVVDAAGAVRGMVSSADLVLKEIPGLRARPVLGVGIGRHGHEHRRAVAGTAAELMTAPARTVHAEQTVGEAADLMRRYRVNQLPVVRASDGRMIGIVTRSDLLRVFARPDTDLHHQIARELLADLPGVRVQVEQGVVMLRGTAPSRAAAERLVRAVEEVAGVVRVDARSLHSADDRYPAAPLNW